MGVIEFMPLEGHAVVRQGEFKPQAHHESLC